MKSSTGKKCCGCSVRAPRGLIFFHQQAVLRACKNKIARLKDGDGVVHDSPLEMERGWSGWWSRISNLCTPETPPSLSADPVTNLFETLVTDGMNEQLCKPFTEEEICTEVFQIGSLKAAGADGIVKAVMEFFRTGDMPAGMNDTSVVLIPKIDNPSELKDFRPISLGNVLYKIVSKCL